MPEAINSKKLDALVASINECNNKKQNKHQSNDELWKTYFKIDPKKFKIKNYSFNYQISTNGTDVSINFINNNKIEKKTRKSNAMVSQSKISRTLKKTMSIEEYTKYKNKQKTRKRH